jgi:TolA-binding protein
MGLALAAGSGCQSVSWLSKWRPFRGPDAPPGPVDSLVLRGDTLEPEILPASGTASAELEGAMRLYNEKRYGEAERIFARIADNNKNTVQLVQTARFYQGDCQRLQRSYKRAANTFTQLVTTFPNGAHAEDARKRMFDIANYWLDDTREAMEEYQKYKKGERWFVRPVSFISFDSTKPLFDCQGHALRLLEQIHITNPGGQYGERALFLIGSVKFYHEDFVEADHFFSQLVNHYPNGPMYGQALQMAIICKQMATGGSEYDGRKLAEARELIDRARATLPREEMQQKEEFFKKQVFAINQQQADSDFGRAEFYRRTGHPGPAYFYYEIVTRRYPGTRYAEKAEQRKQELEKRYGRPASAEPPAQGQPLDYPLNIAPAPRPGVPGSPETGPAPRLLPPGMNDPR